MQAAAKNTQETEQPFFWQRQLSGAVVVFPHHLALSISTAPFAASFFCRMVSAIRFLYESMYLIVHKIY